MWFLHDGTGESLCCLAHGELAWLVLEPDTGLDHCLRILLSRSRALEQGPLLLGPRRDESFLSHMLMLIARRSRIYCWEVFLPCGNKVDVAELTNRRHFTTPEIPHPHDGVGVSGNYRAQRGNAGITQPPSAREGMK